MIIYKVTNKTNSKSYIGQTNRSLHERQLKHYSSIRNGSQLYIHNAIRKYGKKSFSWEILEYCKTQGEMNDKEKSLIQEHQSYWTDNGYNLSLGGDDNGGLCGEVNGMYGKTHSEETLEKIRQSRKGQHDGDKNPSAIHSGTYRITFPDGHQEEIKNLKKWCREHELQHGPFYDMCNGKRTKRYRGYWCERISLPDHMKREKVVG